MNSCMFAMSALKSDEPLFPIWCLLKIDACTRWFTITSRSSKKNEGPMNETFICLLWSWSKEAVSTNSIDDRSSKGVRYYLTVGAVRSRGIKMWYLVLDHGTSTLYLITASFGHFAWIDNLIWGKNSYILSSAKLTQQLAGTRYLWLVKNTGSCGDS